MPKIIAHWSFKAQPEDIDVSRIFRETPAAARVLRIEVGKFRILAMRKELYEAACKAPVDRPRNPRGPQGSCWTPAYGLIGNTYNVMRSPTNEVGGRMYVPSAEASGWVHTISCATAEDELRGHCIRVFDLLDWLNRADAYRASVVGVRVEAF